MKTAGTVTAAPAGGRARIIFGPFQQNQDVAGLHIFCVPETADLFVYMAIRLFTQHPGTDEVAFSGGESVLFAGPQGEDQIVVPVQQHSFIPLDAEMDRFTYIGVEFQTRSSVGSETRCSAGIETSSAAIAAGPHKGRATRNFY